MKKYLFCLNFTIILILLFAFLFILRSIYASGEPGYGGDPIGGPGEPGHGGDPVIPSPPLLFVSCYASPNPANVNQTVSFIAVVSGGIGSYTYHWSGACIGNSSVCYKSFSVAGVYTAYLTVTSGSQFQSTFCSVRVNANLPTVITLPAVESL
jgi:hypothetical protein